MKNPLIFTPRSRLAYAFEFLLTLVMWVFFIYLFLRDVIGVLQKPSMLTAVGESGMLSALTGSLLLYALIALLNGAVVVAWAKYNAYRGREERRKLVGNLSNQELGASFGLSPEVLHGMHAARVMTVHHDERGTIHQVQVGQGPMPTPVPDAAQLLADRGVRPPLLPT